MSFYKKLKTMGNSKDSYVVDSITTKGIVMGTKVANLEKRCYNQFYIRVRFPSWKYLEIVMTETPICSLFEFIDLNCDTIYNECCFTKKDISSTKKKTLLLWI